VCSHYNLTTIITNMTIVKASEGLGNDSRQWMVLGSLTPHDEAGGSFLPRFFPKSTTRAFLKDSHRDTTAHTTQATQNGIATCLPNVQPRMLASLLAASPRRNHFRRKDQHIFEEEGSCGISHGGVEPRQKV
jgi:hypothetical protein